MPPEEAARAALTSALDSWKKGEQPGEVAGTTPVVRVEDFLWKSGAKLLQYEILGVVAGEAPPQFNVRLTVEGTSASEVKYVVVGKDPVWVFRDKDYERTSGG